MLSGEEEFDEEMEEVSLFNVSPTIEHGKAREVSYNSKIPIETFDFIITDKCHRSIYNLWRPALEYFDAFIVGLTATPSMQTLGFFNNNLVMEYSHEKAVADGANVGYEVYKISYRNIRKRKCFNFLLHLRFHYVFTCPAMVLNCVFDTIIH